MKTTSNYGLKKPEGNDVVDIEDFNGNNDIIDKKLKEIELKAGSVISPITSINDKVGAVILSADDIKTTNGTTVEAQITDMLNKSEKLFQFGVDIKNKIVAAINSKGETVTNNMNWEEIINIMGHIYVGYGQELFREIWNYTIADEVNHIAIDTQGDLYIGRDYKDGIQKIKQSNQELFLVCPTEMITSDLMVDINGNIYNSETKNSIKSIRKTNNNGQNVWLYSDGMQYIRGITLDSNGNIYSISDDSTVRKINSNGKEMWRLKVSFSSYSITIDSNCNVYVGDASGNIHKINSSGVLIGTFKNQTDKICTMTTDIHDNVYSGCDDHTIQKINNSGKVIWKFQGDSWIIKIVVDRGENLYAIDSNGNLRGIDNNGKEMWKLTNTKYKNMAIDEGGNLYTCCKDKTLRKLSPNYKL